MSFLRKWATPLTIGSVLIMAVTGVLMFFHLESGLNKVIHEWAGWAMVIGVAAHMVVNWRAFTCYLRRPLAMAIMGGSVALLAISFLPLVEDGGNPALVLARAAQSAPIETVIALSGHELDEGIELLSDAGVILAPGETLKSATGDDRGQLMNALSALF